MQYSSRTLGQVILGAAFLALAIALFAAAMTASLNYDEEQYIAGAYFAPQLALYRDFISFQPPTYTWMLAAAFEFFGGWYVLVGRATTWALSLCCCALLFALLRSFGADRLVAWILVLAFVASPFSWTALTTARNDVMPLVAFLLGIWLCLCPAGGVTSSIPRVLFGGLLISLAAATKYTYAFAPPIMGAAVLYHDFLERTAKPPFGARRSVAFAFGAGLGLLPVIYSVIVHQDRFVFSTLTFHLSAVQDWYQSQGLGWRLTLNGKIDALALRILQSGNAAILLIFTSSALALTVAKYRSRDRIGVWTRHALIVFALFLGALVFAVSAGHHAMYYVAVAALGTLLAGRMYASAKSRFPSWLAALLLVVSIAIASPGVPSHRMIARSLDLSQWTGVQAHRSAIRIADILAARNVSGYVATLFPTVVLEANQVLPELATGPFFFRSADRYPPERVAELRGVGPATLDTLFATSPPAAVVGGFDTGGFKRMDAALIQYARRAGFVLVADDLTVNGYRHGQIWVRSTAHRGGRGAVE